MHALRALVTSRLRWWQEVALVLAGYFAYEVVQFYVTGSARVARLHSGDILGLERWLHLDQEPLVNSWVAGTHWLAMGSGYWYLTWHFWLTPGLLIALYLRRPRQYALYRSVIVIASLVALVAFWRYPVAPPRLADPGIVDVIVQRHIFGAHTPTGDTPLVNAYAAMPSLHVAWAVWCGIAMAVLLAPARTRFWSLRAPRAGWRWACLLGWPAVMTFDVVGTGNHYLLDAVGGAAVMLVTCAGVRAVALAKPRRSEPVPAGRVGGDTRPQALVDT
ncbi:MAG: phosphatase PAP2 family protein [Actinomycetales bacterium]